MQPDFYIIAILTYVGNSLETGKKQVRPGDSSKVLFLEKYPGTWVWNMSGSR